MSLAAARAVADAVLYEGYLLYPYRASAAKNRSRWQFGVLGPPHATPVAFAEPPDLSMTCLLAVGTRSRPAAGANPHTPGAPAERGDLQRPQRHSSPHPEAPSPGVGTPGAQDGADSHTRLGTPAVTVHLRFLQVQVREVQDASRRSVPSLTVGGETFLSWEEAVEHEITMPLPLVPTSASPPLTSPARSRPSTATHPLTPSSELTPGVPTRSLVSSSMIEIPGGEDIEDLPDNCRIVRRRSPLSLGVRMTTEPDGDLLRLTISVTNEHMGEISDKGEAIRYSAVGTHLLLEAHDPVGASFVSLMDPPPEARDAAGHCRQNRCWPVLAGDDRLLLGAPIILYDHPKIAEQSPGELFDGTEIDEILTLRVMTMTDAEKAEARATDPRARTIVDRSDALTAEEFANLHGTWSVDPDHDGVLIHGVRVSKGSLVRVHPRRRSDAQDLFFAGQTARVTKVVSDVDGDTHVALVLADDPAADLHDEAGRYLYFAPDELEPLTEGGRAC
jgi:hypothetical protein